MGKGKREGLRAEKKKEGTGKKSRKCRKEAGKREAREPVEGPWRARGGPMGLEGTLLGWSPPGHDVQLEIHLEAPAVHQLVIFIFDHG